MLSASVQTGRTAWPVKSWGAALRERRLDRPGEMPVPDGRADDDGLVALEDARQVGLDGERAVLLDHLANHNEALPVRCVSAMREEPLAEQPLERFGGLRGGGGLRLHEVTLVVERLARAREVDDAHVPVLRQGAAVREPHGDPLLRYAAIVVPRR